jgi:hypothetical protein
MSAGGTKRRKGDGAARMENDMLNINSDKEETELADMEDSWLIWRKKLRILKNLTTMKESDDEVAAGMNRKEEI